MTKEAQEAERRLLNQHPPEVSVTAELRADVARLEAANAALAAATEKAWAWMQDICDKGYPAWRDDPELQPMIATMMAALSDTGEGWLPPVQPERLAQIFHEAYERLAPEFGYKTRDASAVPWEQVPDDNKRLMIATARAALDVLREVR